MQWPLKNWGMWFQANLFFAGPACPSNGRHALKYGIKTGSYEMVKQSISPGAPPFDCHPGLVPGSRTTRKRPILLPWTPE